MPKKAKKPPREAPVQFRPENELTGRLDALAQLNQISRNEAARRLTILALYELDVRHFDSMSRLAALMGGPPSFRPLCEQVARAVDHAETGRKSAGREALSEDERQHLIRTNLEHLLSQFEPPALPEAPTDTGRRSRGITFPDPAE